ncbi:MULTISPECIES: LysR family transcriptional regulator [unclassified Beijerinckia]|uniref:LysR family transcriptional regulator n=1 Tax=unclassified Beijerinckia TaxID=2638183 RepID=UPI00089B7FFF|nr:MULTISPECIES: LysR family transcriptional regulator [unclassified Beijerinckia]MDH7797480.1 DNA-binding transcriptional LysR family regulator [Beijerinckia sp. GAS462]SEC87326.1 DNA-binding transcriptional regulator, LysR family [Beijerinckia sp. 28-YEA-48]
MNITLKQVRAFLEVAKLKSFTRASERLNATQSSLSVLIRELEAELETRLLDRTTRRVEITEAGLEFLPFAERILGVLGQGLEATRELTARRRGRVSIAASPLAAAALLPRAIARFQQLYPGINVVLEEFPPEQVSMRVADSLCDCGVGVFDTRDEGLTSEPVFQEQQMLLCPRKHPLAAKSEVRWSDLPNYPWIAVGAESAARRRLDRQFALAGISIQPSFEVRNMMTMLGLVDAGIGVAIWPSWAISLARSFDVEIRPLVRPKAVHIVSVAVPKGRIVSPAVEAFIETLKEHARALAKAR